MQEQVDAYDLTKAKLEGYLRRKFPGYRLSDFNVKVRCLHKGAQLFRVLTSISYAMIYSASGCHGVYKK